MTINCNAGYTYTENTTRVCISGKWSGKVGKCEQGKKLLQFNYSTDIVFLCNENPYQTVAKQPPNFAFCQRSNTVFRIRLSDERFLKP